MYCLKCKKKTESHSVGEFMLKNNRRMLAAICSICGCKKSQFLPSNRPTGKGFVNNVISNLPVELHLPTRRGEYVPAGSFNNLQKYSYCGPGTKFEQRNAEGYEGVNELDRACKLHDKFYTNNSDTQSRNISDAALAHRAREISNNFNLDNEQRKYANIVEAVMQAKARFGLGLPSKNLKRGPVKKK